MAGLPLMIQVRLSKKAVSVLKDRHVLSQLVKSWAQDHNHSFTIASPDSGDEGVNATSGFFTWLIQEKHATIDLLDLVERLELYLDHVRSKKYVDGMFCRNCRSYFPYAEPNQKDGTMLCYSCRNNPYV